MLALVVPRAVGCGVRQAAVEKGKKVNDGLRWAVPTNERPSTGPH
jgi:hypothetical protein